MNLLQQLKNAARVYIAQAFPDGPPPRVQEQMAELEGFADDQSLQEWSALEHENAKTAWRLGNQVYPHMKLIFWPSPQGMVFTVDAHDTHFDLPADGEVSDKLIALRQANSAIKTRIEHAWNQGQIPTFGYIQPVLEKTGQFDGCRVMAIDDETKILDLLGMILQNFGIKFERAQSVQEARQRIEAGASPDLIFCDIMMPLESGYDFVNWYHEHELQAPIYYVIGLGSDHVNRNGVLDVIQKPFSVKDIAHVLETHLTGHNLDSSGT